MEDFIFTRLIPIVGLAFTIFMVYKFYPAKDLLDKETIRMVKQFKTAWGVNMGVASGKSRRDSANYQSATTKIGKHIKGMVPFGLLDELNDAEVHAYIMHPDTISFFIKLRELTGGEWKLPGMPQLPGSRKGPGVPEMRRE
jgi:hypothetical protein